MSATLNSCCVVAIEGNIGILIFFIGEAWYIEEDADSGVPLSPMSGVTVGHMDHALLPQKLYFSTSPPPAPVVYHTSSTSQPTPVSNGMSM